MRHLLIAAALAASPGTYASAQDVSGTWRTQSYGSQVRVAPCGAARCGTIVSAPAGARDANNPDARLRGRSLVGVRIFSDARPTGSGWTGQLYYPVDGRTYTGTMRLIGPAALELSGCVLGGLICRSQVWSRVD